MRQLQRIIVTDEISTLLTCHSRSQLSLLQHQQQQHGLCTDYHHPRAPLRGGRCSNEYGIDIGR